MIVIPMAGMSRRFSEAGYSQPKYMLQAHGKSLFSHAVNSFSSYFQNTPFLFIARDVQATEEFIRSEVIKLGILNFQIAILEAPTAGQAQTVSMGLNVADADSNTPLTIFNIDTFRPGFNFPVDFDLNLVDGYLEVFRGGGSNWSYVLPSSDGSNRVIETTEKIPVSDLCCTGLYHFKSVGLFQETYATFLGSGLEAFNLAELYVAPMYNLLINNNHDIRYHLIERDEVIFCGVPSEYKDFLAA